jgi:hypothetical protein
VTSTAVGSLKRCENRRRLAISWRVRSVSDASKSARTLVTEPSANSSMAASVGRVGTAVISTPTTRRSRLSTHLASLPSRQIHAMTGAGLTVRPPSADQPNQFNDFAFARRLHRRLRTWRRSRRGQSSECRPSRSRASPGEGPERRRRFECRREYRRVPARPRRREA